MHKSILTAGPALLGLVDPAGADYKGWKTYLAQQSAARASAKLKEQTKTGAATVRLTRYDEDERLGTRDTNDTPASAQRLQGFGTGAGQSAGAQVVGRLDPEAVATTAIPTAAEDNGAIPLARDTGIGADRSGITTTGTIGDGPHGSVGDKSGDVDFYRVTAAGELIIAHTTTTTGGLNSLLALYDADGPSATWPRTRLVTCSATSTPITPTTNRPCRTRGPATRTEPVRTALVAPPTTSTSTR